MTGANGPSAPQRVAADPRHSAWVTANAGSGKTKVLIDRVARLLLGRVEDQHHLPDPSKILCLTYTRAAAANMQNKLFERLGGWALMDDNDLRDELKELDPNRGDAIVLDRARRLFAQALETPGGLKIQTIHAFCESLLRRFPLEARISPHFTLMDDSDSRALLAEAKDETIRKALDSGSSALRNATERIIDLVQDHSIDALIGQIVSRRLAFAGKTTEIVTRIATALDVGEDETVETARSAMLSRFDRSDLRLLAEAFAGGGKHETAKAPALFEALAEGTDEDLFDALVAALLTAGGTPRKQVPTKAVRDAHDWAEELCAELAAGLMAVTDRARSLEVLANSKALAWFGKSLLNTLNAKKAERDFLDFDDLIRLASDLLNRSEASDWVRYKLDGGVDHILVDEAQDTSAEQWQVIGAIAEEFFAGDGARDVHRTLFVVGDEKQSIYSFQGADPRGLVTVKHRFDELTAGIDAPMQAPELLHSFRSTPAVLDAVDRVFAEDPARTGLSADGAPPRHLAYRENRPGRVELWPGIEPKDAPDPQPWYVPVDEVEPDAPSLRLAEAIATRIRQWLDDGTELVSRSRPIRAGDILILVRRRNAFADAMIRKLKEKGIAVAGEDRMVLTGQLAVRDLMALCRFALLPEDDLTLATVLRSPLIGLSEDALFTLAHGRKGRLWRALWARRDEPAFADAYAILDDLLGQADFLRPYEFLERALSHHGARARFLGRLGVQAEDPIDELLSQAIAFERAETPTLHAFVERIEVTDLQVKREMEQGRNEVRVMTAHGAKGLEANIVFLPDTASLPQPNRNGVFAVPTEAGDAPVWSRKAALDPALIADLRTTRKERELEEYRRLLYVAMTRARDWLIVCGYLTSRPGQGNWLDLVGLGFADAVPCETPLLDDADAPVTGLMIETTGEGRDADPDTDPAEAGVADLPAALMTSAAESSKAQAPVSPSRLTEGDPSVPVPLPSESESDPEPVSSAERGTLMHLLLERLAPLAPDERAEVGARGLRDEDRAALDTVLAILSDAEFAWIFGEASLAEVPVMGPVDALGGRAIWGFIDRLIVTEDVVDIVDFKSGRPPEALPEAYLRQLAVYRAAMGEIFPGRTIRAHLLWIDAGRLETAEDTALDAALSRTRDSLVKSG